MATVWLIGCRSMVVLRDYKERVGRVRGFVPRGQRLRLALSRLGGIYVHRVVSRDFEER
jgi:hypothetical protein